MARPKTSRRRLPSGVVLREWRDGWLFASPFILGVLFFWLGPMLYSLFLVSQDWNMITPPQFIGLDNVRQLFADPLLGTSLWNTAYFTFISVPLQLILALSLAIALNQRLRGESIYRVVFYVPSITPAVASAVVWMQIFNPEYGVLNNILHVFHIPPVKWLFEPAVAKPAFIFMSLWTIGPQMIIFLAGLQNIPKSLLEAAHIDGADAWARFRYVVIPLLSPTIFFNLIIGIIGSFQVFTSSFIMTKGGPQNATLFLVLYIYENGFQWFKMGYAATISWFLFTIVLIFTLLQLKLAGSWVHYEVEN
jgi:multiple sugar transport system permease protein